MKTIDQAPNGETTIRECSVFALKTGHQFVAITLDEKDFRQLIDASPDSLKEWVSYWHCGFRPSK